MVACSTTAKNSNYVTEYQSVLEPLSKLSDVSKLEHAQVFENLFELFADLKNKELAKRVENTYAEQLYFNDTLHTFTDRTRLAQYLKHGADNVEQIKVTFEDISQSGDNYYLRWLMEMNFKVMGKAIESRSIGISQIRFDESGKIVFHQDFWDNTNGFFAHLPLLGSVMQKIKNSMK